MNDNEYKMMINYNLITKGYNLLFYNVSMYDTPLMLN